MNYIDEWTVFSIFQNYPKTSKISYENNMALTFVKFNNPAWILTKNGFNNRMNWKIYFEITISHLIFIAEGNSTRIILSVELNFKATTANM